ncbi:MAG TPA: HemK/PrmC family methyltransferase [Actinomycetota bacterium]|nr:HemK/PrmC family methyltransferase [Actinomycetota bacterium]
MPTDRLERVTRRLAAAGCVAARAEAEELVVAAREEASLEGLIARRERGEPLAWIVGSTRFCGRTLHVEPGVYVPRAQSEELARRAAALLAGSDGGWAADLCTGAGAIAAYLMAEVPAAAVIGVDIDPVAVACARRNGVRTVRGDLDGPLGSGAFDVVTAVAPYVPTRDMRLLRADVRRYEPRLALDGGGDGLDVVGRVVRGAARLLRPGGWLLIELGGDQDRTLEQALSAAGFSAAVTWSDDDGELRGLAARAQPM